MRVQQRGRVAVQVDLVGSERVYRRRRVPARRAQIHQRATACWIHRQRADTPTHLAGGLVGEQEVLHEQRRSDPGDLRIIAQPIHDPRAIRLRIGAERPVASKHLLVNAPKVVDGDGAHAKRDGVVHGEGGGDEGRAEHQPKDDERRA